MKIYYRKRSLKLETKKVSHSPGLTNQKPVIDQSHSPVWMAGTLTSKVCRVDFITLENKDLLLLLLLLLLLSPINIPSLTMASTSASTTRSESSWRMPASLNFVVDGFEKSDTGAGVDTRMIETHLRSLRKKIRCLQCTGWMAGENLSS